MDARLPPELSDMILSHLSFQDILLRVAPLSKANLRCASSPGLWKQLIKRDFKIDVLSKDPKATYKKMLLASNKEIANFEKYVLILEAFRLKTQLMRSNGEFVNEHETNPEAARQWEDEKEQRTFKELQNKLDDRLLSSIDELDNQFSVYVELLPDTLFKEALQSAKMMLPVLLSNQVQVDFSVTTEDEETNALKEYVLGCFETLCKLDAYVLMGMLIDKIPSLMRKAIAYQAFRYACPNVINVLLDHHLDGNEKIWIHDRYVSSHATPLLIAIQYIKNASAFKQIVETLITHGADTNIKCYSLDEDCTSEEKYLKYAKSIHELCKRWEEGIADFKTATDKKLFTEAMQMIMGQEMNPDAKVRPGSA